MERKEPNSQLQRIIDVDMKEVKRGCVKPEIVKNRIDQYVNHYGVDVFIAGYIIRYEKVIGDEYAR